MNKCENCINECICNLCVCCHVEPCVCTMKPNDFITNKEYHKNCINKEKLIEYLIEHDTLDMELIIEYLERGLFDNE